jgi:hypothetical protein
MTWKERERSFYIGATLAIVPGLAFLPAVMFLVVVPKVPHAQLLAIVVLPVLALAGSVGLWKLAMGAVQRPFGILNALSFGALIVLVIIAGYTGIFLAVVSARF